MLRTSGTAGVNGDNLGLVNLYYTLCLKKAVQNYFCQNFLKFPPTENFWHRDAKEDKLM